MSLTADSLKSNEEQKKSLARETNYVLSRIDDELKVAHELGKHIIQTTLPITFSIPYMTNTEAQRKIYFAVLASLKNRGFHVKIQLKPNQTLFIITWFSSDELKELELQNALLAKHTESTSL